MYLLFDIGGTNMRLAVSREGKEVESVKTISSPQDFKEAIKKFSEVTRGISGGQKITKAAGGVAGPLDKKKGVMLSAPQLPSWAGKPLKEVLQEALKAPVFLENDVALVGFGEATYGAGKEFSLVAYYIIGSGINGVRIVDGRIDRAALGFELGHQIIDAKSKQKDGTGMQGTLELYVGGANIEKRYGVKPEEIKEPKAWNEIARWFAIGLSNTIVHWSPEVIVLGGSIMKTIPMERVKHHLSKLLTVFPKEQHPPIKRARLGDEGGLWGALAYLRQMQES